MSHYCVILSVSLSNDLFVFVCLGLFFVFFLGGGWGEGGGLHRVHWDICDFTRVRVCMHACVRVLRKSVSDVKINAFSSCCSFGL